MCAGAAAPHTVARLPVVSAAARYNTGTERIAAERGRPQQSPGNPRNRALANGYECSPEPNRSSAHGVQEAAVCGYRGAAKPVKKTTSGYRMHIRRSLASPPKASVDLYVASFGKNTSFLPLWGLLTALGRGRGLAIKRKEDYGGARVWNTRGVANINALLQGEGPWCGGLETERIMRGCSLLHETLLAHICNDGLSHG